MASCIGGTIGMFILTFMGPGLANLGLKFGPSEMTAILLIAMTSISWLVGENPIKGVVITCFGILLASMGMDTLSGAPRYEFGSMLCSAAFRLPCLSLVRLALHRSSS